MHYQLQLLIPLLGLALWAQSARAQDPPILRLEQCLQAAVESDLRQERSPLLREQESLQYEQLRSRRLPQVQWSAQGQLQSEVADFPFELPPPIGDPLDLPLYRAQTALEANYLLYDGGRSRQQREVIAARTELGQVQNKAEIDRVKSQVQDLFFGILRLNQGQKILDNSLDALGIQENRLDALIQQGAALPLDRERIQVKQLELESQLAGLKADERALRRTLEDLTDLPIPDDIQLAVPDYPLPADIPLERKELDVFAARQTLLDAQTQRIRSEFRPTVGVFAQAGFGYPNPLNFFEAEFSPFALGGLQFSWNILQWNQRSTREQLLTVERRQAELEQALFIRQTDRISLQYEERMRKLREQIRLSEDILDRQRSMLRTLEQQLELGVATTSDYLLQLNATTKAQLQQSELQIQLIHQQTAFLIHRGAL